MFTMAARYSIPQAAEDKAGKIYEQAKSIWSKQTGFQSMQRYRIVEGPHANQQMVVVRFTDRNSLTTARDKIKTEREKFLKELADTGTKTEEMLMLDEVV
jgi:heme-degrading monooxygenase HmoA